MREYSASALRTPPRLHFVATDLLIEILHFVLYILHVFVEINERRIPIIVNAIVVCVWYEYVFHIHYSKKSLCVCSVHVYIPTISANPDLHPIVTQFPIMTSIQ